MKPEHLAQLEECVRRGILTREQADEWIASDARIREEQAKIARLLGISRMLCEYPGCSRLAADMDAKPRCCAQGHRIVP